MPAGPTAERSARPVAVPAALPLGVRNRLAELILEAFDLPEARATLQALAAFCRGEALDADGGARLLDLGWFVRAPRGRIGLLGAHRAHRGALCGRATAAATMLARGGAGDGQSLGGLLARAACLADAGLYFELHELLEPRWIRAAGDERLGLQGLIQVAVALHHADSGNRRGAIALMAEALAKLDAAAPALPLPTAAWRVALARVLAAWRDGAPPPPNPPWPRPTETEWRCS